MRRSAGRHTSVSRRSMVERCSRSISRLSSQGSSWSQYSFTSLSAPCAENDERGVSPFSEKLPRPKSLLSENDDLPKSPLSEKLPRSEKEKDSRCSEKLPRFSLKPELADTTLEKTECTCSQLGDALAESLLSESSLKPSDLSLPRRAGSSLKKRLSSTLSLGEGISASGQGSGSARSASWLTLRPMPRVMEGRSSSSPGSEMTNCGSG